MIIVRKGFKMTIKEEYTVNEVASILQTNPETVRKWIKEGKLTAIPGNSKKEGMRIDEPALESFLAENPKYTTPAYITATLAILTGGISIPASIILNAQKRAQRNAKKERDSLYNSRIKASDIVRLLQEEISQEEKTIAEKSKLIESIEREINDKLDRIENIKQMITDLQNEENHESAKYSYKNSKDTNTKVPEAKKSEKKSKQELESMTDDS